MLLVATVWYVPFGMVRPIDDAASHPFLSTSLAKVADLKFIHYINVRPVGLGKESTSLASNNSVNG